jgi:catechol 2,3-dioxygenase-like lactoylglutathione lyase family enzyme
MAQGARIGSVVMFVSDLHRSVSFYTDLLALEVADRSTTAALLRSAEGSQLILRSMGGNAARALGSIGVQYVVWTAASEQDLERCERVLRTRSAHVQTRTTSDRNSAVEGRDPDGVEVVITYPGPDRAPLHELPVRIYGW